MITAPNTWLASRYRFALLADLWSAVRLAVGLAAWIPCPGGHPRWGAARCRCEEGQLGTEARLSLPDQ